MRKILFILIAFSFSANAQVQQLENLFKPPTQITSAKMNSLIQYTASKVDSVTISGDSLVTWADSTTKRKAVFGAVGPTGPAGLSGDRYQTASTTLFEILNINDTVSFIISDSLAYTPNQGILVTPCFSILDFFIGYVIDYNLTSGLMSIYITSLSTGLGLSYDSWIVNLDGAVGAVGATGATGPSGSNGATGATGVVGATGPSGNNGAVGATGPTGNNGTNGATGSTGPSGVDGATGPTGVAGATGASGSNGATGSTGIGYRVTSPWSTTSLTIGTGTKVFTTVSAPTGFAYVAGDRIRAAGLISSNYMEGVIAIIVGSNVTVSIDQTGGSGTYNNWSVGIAGNPGNSGATGATGPSGVDGATGPIGATGPSGVDGATGATGPTGTAGSNGATGSTGPTGTAGSNGATGSTGTAGTNGATGGTGATGPTGTVGASGPSGSNGSNGATGATGVAGATGATGSSVSVRDNLQLIISNNGAVISTGYQGQFSVPFNCASIDSVWLLGDSSADVITIGLWKTSYSSFAPTVTHPIAADSITNGHPPQLSSASKSTYVIGANWTVSSLTAGDIIGINTNTSPSVAIIRNLTFILWVTRQ